FVAHHPHVVVVPHRNFVVGKGTLSNSHWRTPNMAHVFNRWGTQVARPLGPSAGTPEARHLALNTPRQTLRGSASPAVAQPGSSVPRVGASPWREAPSSNAASGASTANPQVFRRQGGQWQQFQGNGQWQNVTPSAPGGSSRPPAQAQGLAAAGQPR